MAELARRVTAIAAEEFGYKGKVVLGKSDDAEYLTDNPNRRCPIITKARTELGYEPSIGPDEGLKRSLLWYAGNQVAELA
jgi:nucleoside-diphosphate-sugar epimerase